MHTGHGMQVAVRARFTGAGSHHLPCGSQISHLGGQTRVQASFLHSSNFTYQSPHDNIVNMWSCVSWHLGHTEHTLFGHESSCEPPASEWVHFSLWSANFAYHLLRAWHLSPSVLISFTLPFWGGSAGIFVLMFGSLFLLCVVLLRWQSVKREMTWLPSYQNVTSRSECK